MSRKPLLLHTVVLATLAAIGCDREPAGPTAARPAFIITQSPNSFTRVDTGSDYSCGLRTDGVVECWGVIGAADWGQAPPTKTAQVGHFTEISTGHYHGCALRNDGVVECWDASRGVAAAPAVKVAAVGQFTQVSSGTFTHTCALRSDGVIECWGTDDSGGPIPTIVTAATGSFVQVSAGYWHNCALRTDGMLQCWQWNDLARAAAPASRAAQLGVYTQVGTGLFQTCALRDDGQAECWDGAGTNYHAATTGRFTQIGVGSWHGCGLRDDGVIQCWGENDAGQAPATRTAAIGKYTSLAAGAFHTCAVREDGVIECWGSDQWGQGPATRIAGGGTAVHIHPTATFGATPAPVVVGQAFTLSLANAQVPGYSGSVTFSYAFDCGDGAGYGTFAAASSASCSTSAIGTRNVGGKVRDQDGDLTEYTGSVAVIYPFSGFQGSIDPPPVFNVVKAGGAVPAKFNLGGNEGLAIVAAGYPKSQPVRCDASSPSDPIEETVTAGASGLSYDATTGQYTYVWKTEKAWANTCRLMTLRLADGAEYTALFKFSR